MYSSSDDAMRSDAAGHREAAGVAGQTTKDLDEGHHRLGHGLHLCLPAALHLSAGTIM